MIFTESNDGKMRTTITLKVRLDQETINDIVSAVARYRGSLGEKRKDVLYFLENALEAGIEDGLSSYHDA